MRYLIEIGFTVLLLTALSDGQLQGSDCTLKDTGKAGVCTPLAKCQSAQGATSKGHLPQRCDLNDNDSELVCCVAATCPPLMEGLVNQRPIGSKAADYCIELAEKIHPCQETDSGWTRGSVCSDLTPDLNLEYYMTVMTTMAEGPFFGQLGEGQIDDVKWSDLSVTLVSDQWVLISAFYANFPTLEFVGLGGTFEPQYIPDEIYHVDETLIHPLYDGPYEAYYDIALLRLDRRVTFTTRILPACLHTGTLLPDNALIETGWVRYDTYKGHFKTTMHRVSREQCAKEFLPGMLEHYAGVQHDLEICSRPTQLNTTEGCGGWYRGDALTVHNNHRVACTHLLVGMKITTAQLTCTTTYTRISKMVPWIESIVWPDTNV